MMVNTASVAAFDGQVGHGFVEGLLSFTLLPFISKISLFPSLFSRRKSDWSKVGSWLSPSFQVKRERSERNAAIAAAKAAEKEHSSPDHLRAGDPKAIIKLDKP